MERVTCQQFIGYLKHMSKIIRIFLPNLCLQRFCSSNAFSQKIHQQFEAWFFLKWVQSNLDNVIIIIYNMYKEDKKNRNLIYWQNAHLCWMFW